MTHAGTAGTGAPAASRVPHWTPAMHRAYRRALIKVWQRRYSHGDPGYVVKGIEMSMDRGGIARPHAVASITGRLDRRSARRWR